MLQQLPRLVKSSLLTGIDQANDLLGDVVAWSGLASEDLDTRDNLLAISRAHLLECKVAVDASEGIHKLSLILVDTLDLNREERVRVDRDIERTFNVLGKADLVLVFDIVKTLDERSIFDLGLELAKLAGIGQPRIAAESLRNELGKTRIALQQPSTEGDTVGDVLEFVRATVT